MLDDLTALSDCVCFEFIDWFRKMVGNYLEINTNVLIYDRRNIHYLMFTSLKL